MKRSQVRFRLATSNGKLVGSFARSRHFRRLRSTHMHSEQVIGAKRQALSASTVNDGGPGALRDSTSLLPLGDGPRTLADIGGHLWQRVPGRKKLSQRYHTEQNTRDILSRQDRTRPPMTLESGGGTMCPQMGSRATTPKEFKESFARRLRAARELKYELASDFAADLGIPPNTYGKYESGRSLMPHHLIPRACELLGISIETLFEFEKRARRAA